MIKSQIAVRVPSPLLAELNSYVEETGISKTEVVVSAVAKYLGYTYLETQVKGMCRGS
ncbi:MAG: DNA-binding domain-containing protein [Crocosphaera sp.]|nr:DNA-binding domain-containing protein [Crocosphaera sp.]